MLEVKVILRNAVTGEVSEIANMVIVNDGTGDAREGNYFVSAWEQRPPTRGRMLRDGRVERHDRTRSVWALVFKAIASVYGE